jgi:phosphopantothenoylcysteine decarboxylase/phosphopantothenate--cysteine ligase
MAAAVADARPVTVATEKLPKGAYTEIELVENDDILAALSARRAGQVIIGFAAQTGTDAVEKGSAKLAAKGLDFIYVNDVSNGEIFGKDETQGTIIDSQGKIEHINQISKVTLAEQLLTKAIDKLGYAND